MNRGPVTRPTLLESVKDANNNEAWDRFFELYTPLVQAYSNSRGCNPEMADEVLQETMISLLAELPKFEYTPGRGRFRSYLLSIVNNRIRRAFQRQSIHQNRHNSLEAIENTGKQHSISLIDTKLDQPGSDWDKLWENNIALQALIQVRARVGQIAYRSFELNVLEGWSVKTVAAELSLSPNEIYQHKDRLKKMLRQEYQTLVLEIGE